jgi:hypothetical protein
MHPKLKASTCCCVILLAALFILSFYVGDTATDFALNHTALVFGASTGWVTGIIVTPYTEKEKGQFTSLAKTVAAFSSGYLVGKIDPIMVALLEPEYVLDTVHGFRLIAGLSAFTLATTITFVYRQYA